VAYLKQSKPPVTSGFKKVGLKIYLSCIYLGTGYAWIFTLGLG
jgi:hypothetical protein